MTVIFKSVTNMLLVCSTCLFTEGTERLRQPWKFQKYPASLLFYNVSRVTSTANMSTVCLPLSQSTGGLHFKRLSPTYPGENQEGGMT